MNISDAVSILAVVIAFVSLYRTRKQHELENKYNETSSKLAELQLRILERKEAENNSANISVYFYKDFKSNYRIALSNTGNAPAKDVRLSLKIPEGTRSPLIESDVISKLPAKLLHPGEEIYLLAAITLSMTPVFEAETTWTNPDGNTVNKKSILTLPG